MHDPAGTKRHRPGGTRFRLFPQFDEGLPAEVVEVSSPVGSVGPGPCDARMYVADAVGKIVPYAPPDPAPPWSGRVHPPAEPDTRGHFDTLAPDTPQFRAAHLFGTVRLVLDIWERHTGETVHWWHPQAPQRLELVPVVRWRNAQSGPGFIETGIWPGFAGGGEQHFCFNFDVVAHEVGHAILFGAVGVPPPDLLDEQFLGYHESFGDQISVLGALHFASVRRRLLEQTFGDLYALNLVNRLAETAPHQQIRLACTKTIMADVAGLRLRPDGGWFDPAGLGRNAHALSEPMTGAVFDLLVELYQDGVARRGLIRSAMDVRGWTPSAVAGSLAGIHAEHRRAFARFAAGFDAALLEARDAIAGCLVHAIRRLTAEDVTFGRVAARMLEALGDAGFERLLDRLLPLFLRRGIEPRPHLRAMPVLHHGSMRPSRRGAVLSSGPALPASCRCADPRFLAAARELMPHAHRAV